MGAANPLGAARAVRRQAKRAGARRRLLRASWWATTSPRCCARMPRTAADGKRRAAGNAAAAHGLGQRLSRRRRAAARRCTRAPKRGDPGRVADPSLFLGAGDAPPGWSYDDCRGSPPARSPATCSNAARRPAAAASPIPARRRSMTSPTAACPSPMSTPTAIVCDRQGGRHRRPRRPQDLHRAAALRDARPGQLPHAGLRARHHRRGPGRHVGPDRVQARAPAASRARGTLQGHGRLPSTAISATARVSYAGVERGGARQARRADRAASG